MRRHSLLIGLVVALLAALVVPAPSTTSAGACPPATASQRLGVRYDAIAGVDPDLLSYDLYRPQRDDPCVLAPVVVYVHGGGWTGGDKRSQIEAKRALFAEAGYVFVSECRRAPGSPRSS